MPTTRPRHLLTETDDIAEAIDAAAHLYPGASRADILRRLIHIGYETIADEQVRHRIIVRELAGRFAGLYPEGYLDDLRKEWRE
jgi:hypothetical protein